MSVIKYRFWSGEKMFHGTIAIECLRQQLHFENKSVGEIGYDHIGLHNASFDRFTGYQNKNGVDIYENDLLKDDDGGFIYRVVIKEVNLGTDDYGVGYRANCVCIEYQDGSGFAALTQNSNSDYSVSASECDTIGTIHTNPELFKK